MVTRDIGKLLAELEELLVDLGYPEDKVCELINDLEARIDDMECQNGDDASGE